jgi:hypothetical protein
MSQRSFLATAGGLALGAALADTARALDTRQNHAISPLMLSIDPYVSPTPQRFVFAVALGAQHASTAPASIAFAPPGQPRGAPLATRLYRDRLPEGRGVYVTQVVFDESGTWQAAVFTRHKQAPLAVGVNPLPTAPPVGSDAPRVPSPTPSNTLGVDPICTRQPPCPLHAVSLSDVIGGPNPLAVLFATPALCQTGYCGPVLDELLSVKDRYPGTVFVHVETYTSNTGADLAPTVKAWHGPGANPPVLPGEPFFFTINRAGRIFGLLDGAFGREEISQQLDLLAAAGG